MNNVPHVWFYMKKTILSEDQIGPVSEAEIKNLILSGAMKPETKISSPTRTKGQWRLMRAIPTLFQLYERGVVDRENQKVFSKQAIASARKEQQGKRQREKSLRLTEKKLDAEKRIAAREAQVKQQMQQSAAADQRPDENPASGNQLLVGMILRVSAVIAVLIVLTTIGFIIYGGIGEGGGGANVVRNIFSNVKVKHVSVGAGDVTITDDEDGVSHVKIECNNGLVIDADWERNPYNDFGYDIFEPDVSMDYNRMAIMLTARGVIASYLRGEYD